MSAGRYSHTLHEHALDVLFGLRLTERRKVMDECAAIVRSPFQEPDYQRAEDDGRLMSFAIRGRFAIVYWVDHGARLVFITRIEIADLG
jgi:hypothetical protein